MLTEKEFYKKLSLFIKSRRRELNLTNESLFMSSGVDISKISLLQNNKSGCTAYTTYKLLVSLNIDIFKTNDERNDVMQEAIKSTEKTLALLKTLNINLS